jgi:putative phosphoribosyl transferase
MQIYQDRQIAGRLLANLLTSFQEKENTLIMALPRGGVPLGFELAICLRLPLDIFLVRKLGVPGQAELAMGAITIDDVCVFNQEIIQALQIPQDSIHQEIDRQKKILAERNNLYRKNKPLPKLADQSIILVDDGLATGATMRAAVNTIKLYNPKQIIIAVPVAPTDVCEQLAHEVDEIVCLQTPEPFYGVGNWYRNFEQVTDDEVINLLYDSRLKHLSEVN